MNRKFPKVVEVLAGVLLISPAYADVVISITPQTPGPFAPGSMVTMDVFLTQVNIDPADPQPLQGLRLVQFDFADSDTAPGELVLGALGGNPQTQRITWDFTSVIAGSAAYFQDRDLLNSPAGLVTVTSTLLNYPNGSTIDPSIGDPEFPCTENCDWNTYMYLLPATGAGRMATLQVTLPNAMGNYEIDPLNADNVTPGNPVLGAAVSWGFGVDEINDPIVLLQLGTGLSFDSIGTFYPDPANPGMFAYGIPEPATLVLLALSGMAALRRSRTA